MTDTNTETARLYWDDPMRETFEAKVRRSVEQPEGGALIVLDRTLFYPEGGGQPADEGQLGDAEVLDVREEEGVVLHLTDRSLEEGSTVEGSVDWGRRWDHMQQHSGQHLLSRVLLDEYGAETRGFHLGADEATIDLGIELDEGQVEFARSRANALIDRDLPVTARIVPRDHPAVDAARRVPPEIEEVRLVEIEEVDSVPCGGTHVPSTARIGGLHVMAGSGTRVHGGLFRITFLCGGRMRRYLAHLDRVSARLTRELTTAPDQFLERFEDLKDQIKDLNREVSDLQGVLVPLRAEVLLEQAETIGPARVVMARIDDLPAETLPALAGELTAHADVAALLGAEVSGTGRLAFARGEGLDLHMGELLSRAAAILGGGGGGRPEYAAGGGTQAEALDTALTSAREEIREALG
ncbi:MAG: DHHA1 domain-containing protein [bacterium]